MSDLNCLIMELNEIREHIGGNAEVKVDMQVGPNHVRGEVDGLDFHKPSGGIPFVILEAYAEEDF